MRRKNYVENGPNRAKQHTYMYRNLLKINAKTDSNHFKIKKVELISKSRHVRIESYATEMHSSRASCLFSAFVART
jgi:hypothetical protein